MNPVTVEQLPPPPQPPQPNQKSTSCDRHPDEQFTGFCPSCLCERLAVLDKSSATVCSGRKSASSALKSLFKPSNDALRGRPSSSSFLPELRRTKSFSGGKNEGGFLGISGVFEPQRKSCDVRGRSTLFSLFSQDDEKRHQVPHPIIINEASTSSVVIELKGEVGDHVVAEEEEEGEEEEEEFHDNNDNGDEIRVLEEEIFESKNCGDKLRISSGEQVGGIIVLGQKAEVKPMKDHIDLDSQNKKVGSKDLKEIAGSFWSAASVFSKKLRAWTKKNNNHKLKKHINGSYTVQVSGKKGNVGRNYRDTQSENADYGFGRRSCDTDPRFSLDAGRFSVDAATTAGRFSIDAARMSFDDLRCSFDEPRASWDGYLIGKPFPRMMPPMVSVVEDVPSVMAPTSTSSSTLRKDTQIPVEEPRRSSVSINGDEAIPGGAVQTKDYYSDSSSKRRRSLDRSSSIRKTAASVVAEMDETKIVSESKLSSACVDYLSGTKVVSGDRRDFRELDLNSNSYSNSLRDDYSETFDMGCRDNASFIGSNCDRKEGSKKSRRWRAWNIWGLIYRRGNSKDEEEDRYSRAIPNGVERSYSESWQDLRTQGYGDTRGAGFGRNVFRSNSSVSWRNSYGSFGSIRKPAIDGKKKKDEFVLERNQSARYSPNHGADNGMLRFYLTPMRGSRRGSSGKPKPAYPHSFARSMLRFY